MGLMNGFNIAKSTLDAQTTIMNVAGHNIANANTPGYSRQDVKLESVSHNSVNGFVAGQKVIIGSGVKVAEIERARFALYDTMFRKERQELSAYEKSEDLMSQVELIFDEPSDRGIASKLDAFFNEWYDASNEPQNMASRQSLKSSANELTAHIRSIHSRLLDMSENIDRQIAAISPQINQISFEIASLNGSIRIATAKGNTASDLKDKRDLLLDELSALGNVNAVEQDDGTTTVYFGVNLLVESNRHNDLNTISKVDVAKGVNKTVIVSAEGLEYEPEYGTLGALVDFRDRQLNEIMDGLNTLAENLVTSINYQHREGYGLDGGTGYDFFNATNLKAFNISVSTDVADNEHIALSGDGARGDNSNALKLHDVMDLDVIDFKYTIPEHYNAMISTIGIMSREAQAGRKNEELLVGQLDNARESIKGVNTDEEMIKLITAQRIYQGASRLIAIFDSLLEEIISMG